jgi:flagellar FliJ protein
MLFRFRLAPVLRHRKRLEDAAALDLAQAQQRLEAISRQLTRTRDEMAARTRALAARAARGTTGMELEHLARDVQTLGLRSEISAAEAAEQRGRTQQARESLVEASRSRQVLERLEDSQRAAHARQLDVVERRQTDDVTAANYLWRGAQTALEREPAP